MAPTLARTVHLINLARANLGLPPYDGPLTNEAVFDQLGCPQEVAHDPVSPVKAKRRKMMSILNSIRSLELCQCRTGQTLVFLADSHERGS